VGLDTHPRMLTNTLRRNFMLKFLIKKINSYFAKRKHLKRIKELRKMDPFIYD